MTGLVGLLLRTVFGLLPLLPVVSADTVKRGFLLSFSCELLLAAVDSLLESRLRPPLLGLVVNVDDEVMDESDQDD